MNNILPSNLNWEDWLNDNLSETERKQWHDLLLTDESLRLESETLRQLDKGLQQAALREKVRENGKIVAENFRTQSGNQGVSRILKIAMLVAIGGIFCFVTTQIMSDFFPTIQPPVPNQGSPSIPSVPEPQVQENKTLPSSPSVLNQPIAQKETPTPSKEPVSGIRGGNNKASSVVDTGSFQQEYTRPNLDKLKKTPWNPVIVALENKQLEKATNQLSNYPSNNDTTHYLLAICQLESNQAAESARHLMRIYQSSNPFYQDVQWLLACCFKKTDRLSNARQILKNIVATPGHPWAKQAQINLDAWGD